MLEWRAARVVLAKRLVVGIGTCLVLQGQLTPALVGLRSLRILVEGVGGLRICVSLLLIVLSRYAWLATARG